MSAVGIIDWRIGNGLAANKGLFGVRIDVLRSLHYDAGQPPLLNNAEWANCGSFQVEYSVLTENAIRSIRESDHQDYEFSITLEQTASEQAALRINFSSGTSVARK